MEEEKSRFSLCPHANSRLDFRTNKKNPHNKQTNISITKRGKKCIFWEKKTSKNYGELKQKIMTILLRAGTDKHLIPIALKAYMRGKANRKRRTRKGNPSKKVSGPKKNPPSFLPFPPPPHVF